MTFRTPLVLEADRRPDNWIVRAPLVWEADSDGERITVPAGTLTDLASIPQFLRNIGFLDPNGHSRLPAVLHDYLYRGGTVDRTGERVTRAQADALLRAALLSEGAGQSVATIFYLAVRSCGGDCWTP